MLRHLSFIPLLLILLVAAPALSAAETVKPGDQLLYEEGFQPLKGKRFALVTNHSAIVEGVHVLELMGRKGVMPSVIFTPEHGLEGRAEDGARLDDGSYHGVPVKSLYGASKKPNPDDLKGLDLVVFDIQDVGVRFYTYISTMGYVMQAAAEAGVPFVVLDRPNPLGGNYVAGFVRDKLPATFTSLYPIPEAHGLTVGELAYLIKGEGLLPGLANLDLSVVRIQGWERWMRWPDTGLPWIATSPNLASFDSALLYPGTGLLEGTSASEGRGSNEPFRLAGWPEIDGQALATKLNAEGLPGLHFEPVRFKPVSMPGVSSAPKYKNREISGVRLVITDYHSVLPVESGIAVLAGLYRAVKEPARKVFFHGGIDDMSGSTEVRSGIEAGMGAPAIVAKWGEGDQKFLELRRKYLLYQ
ncbi:exo-beta-N-acetylmuramidase NamZ family protein [Geomonas sp. Red276]